MDIFKRPGRKKTASFNLSEDTLRSVARMARQLKRSKSNVVDQLLLWGLERYEKEAAKRG